MPCFAGRLIPPPPSPSLDDYGAVSARRTDTHSISSFIINACTKYTTWYSNSTIHPSRRNRAHPALPRQNPRPIHGPSAMLPNTLQQLWLLQRCSGVGGASNHHQPEPLGGHVHSSSTMPHPRSDLPAHQFHISHLQLPRPFVRSSVRPFACLSRLLQQYSTLAASRALPRIPSPPSAHPSPCSSLSLSPAHPSYPGSAPVTSDHLPPSLPPAQRIIQQESTSRGHPPNLPCHPRQAHQLAKMSRSSPESHYGSGQARSLASPSGLQQPTRARCAPPSPPSLSRHAECKASVPIGPCPSRAAPSESCLATHTAFIEACEWPSGRIRGTSCRDATVRGLNENHLRRSRYSLMPKGRFS